jgi:UbiD family decarboxylase
MRGYNNLSEWLADIEKAGELVRVKAEVDPILEITEIAYRWKECSIQRYLDFAFCDSF